MELIDKKISKIHNYIYANEGLSNSEVLNEFLNYDVNNIELIDFV